MRPNKQINPGAHRSGPARSGKGRFFTAPSDSSQEASDAADIQQTPPQPARPAAAPILNKYAARASVAPDSDEPDEAGGELTNEEWTDPLDEEELDLTTVTIDLRETRRRNPPATYYERIVSKIPGRQ